QLRRGKAQNEAVFTISVRIPPGHYIYSMTDPGPATRLDIKKIQGLEAIDELPQPDHSPKVEVDPNLGQTTEKYVNAVTWTQRYRLRPGTPPASVLLAGQVKYQICNDKNCRYPKAPFELRLASDAPPEAREEEDNAAEAEAAPLSALPLDFVRSS